ncbi:MAG TPA: tol-pal system-associated acyl-CoA thioesterase [Mariprofundaceae bacterium]|nr:tol-pal system-associated acyl-CoA thioesterase [Mariprofundaceae bacterium]
MTAFSHTFPVRIYYEDTDHGGVVYYANYLKFMERARTELLRDRGIELDELEDTESVMFAVTEAHVFYRAPALFNDAIDVETRLTELKGVRLAFRQRILRNDEILVEGEIRLACIDRDGKPKRIPSSVSEIMERELS